MRGCCKPSTASLIKSNGFRCVRADGSIGGITPNGHIHMAFFSERSAIPRRVIHELTADGQLGNTKEMETRNSIVRELDVDVFMTSEVARSLYDWLGSQLKEYDKLLPTKGKRPK